MSTRYPTLVAEIAKRGVKKKDIAASIGISYKCFYNKLEGRSPFTWDEVRAITTQFFPYMLPSELFQPADQ